ncbi:MAG: hypothetical protein Q8911_00345 [Bacillota bacterium]|nr:hypothetical protein [Bacillota bacterium]
MTRPLNFDEEIALKLYHELKSDREIGAVVGKSSNTIALWRNRRNLPSLTIDKRTGMNYQVGCNFRKVLTPQQAVEMDRFLQALSWAARQAIEVGVKPDINNFINRWSGRGRNVEEQKFKHKMVMRKIRDRKKSVIQGG